MVVQFAAPRMGLTLILPGTGCLPLRSASHQAGQGQLTSLDSGMAAPPAAAATAAAAPVAMAGPAAGRAASLRGCCIEGPRAPDENSGTSAAAQSCSSIARHRAAAASLALGLRHSGDGAVHKLELTRDHTFKKSLLP